VGVGDCNRSRQRRGRSSSTAEVGTGTDWAGLGKRPARDGACAISAPVVSSPRGLGQPQLAWCLAIESVHCTYSNWHRASRAVLYYVHPTSALVPTAPEPWSTPMLPGPLIPSIASIPPTCSTSTDRRSRILSRMRREECRNPRTIFNRCICVQSCRLADPQMDFVAPPDHQPTHHVSQAQNNTHNKNRRQS
jgi:hypothetical protein